MLCGSGRPHGKRERFFFFFQAEDGIRDYKVTGVQTCALPIFVYVGDTEHCPYGPRPIAEVRRFALDVMDHLVEEHQVKLLVIACNAASSRSEEHTSELQPPCNLVCRLLLEKNKQTITAPNEQY